MLSSLFHLVLYYTCIITQAQKYREKECKVIDFDNFDIIRI